MQRLFLGMAAAYICAGTGWAMDQPAVPGSAKKLDAAGIRALYQGAYASFDNKQNKETLTGNIFYDLKNKALFGTYNFGNKNKGIFRGKAWVKDDQFCYRTPSTKDTCMSVFRDGRTYYEVDAKGKVTSVDTLLDNPPSLPADAKKISSAEVLELVKGQRIFVTIFDFEKPLVADIKWDTKKKRSVGKFISGGTREGKVNASYTVKAEQVCWTVDKTDCYDYYRIADGFLELKTDGKVHAISKFQ
jgi:hypothetical protein